MKYIEEEDGLVFRTKEQEKKAKAQLEEAKRNKGKQLSLFPESELVHDILLDDPDKFFSKRPKGNNKTINSLLDMFEYWQNHIGQYYSEAPYNTDSVSDLARLTKTTYTLRDLEGLMVPLGNKLKQMQRPRKVGFFLTGLIKDKVRQDDTVFLDLRNIGSFESIGYKLEEGNVVLVGNSSKTGERMTGGTITIYGNVSYAGMCMKEGKINVFGDGNAGSAMTGGKVEIYGNLRKHSADRMRGGEILAHGNAEERQCAKMQGGRVIIKGDGEDNIGFFMYDGEVIVDGNCGAYVGSNMEGGIIRVKGDVTDYLGYDSKGGEIHIDGNYKGFVKSRCKAKIYHKGKKIWPSKK